VRLFGDGQWDAIDRGCDDAPAGRVSQFETGDQFDALFASV
jgi:hypothetical protein